MKFFLILFISFILFNVSCATQNSSKNKEKNELSPEIITTEIKGGGKVAIRGYSQDHEMNKKMKLLDFEIADCYKQFVPLGIKKEMVINYNIIIDESGLIETASFKNGDQIFNKIANCIAKDMKELYFRPGDIRELNYRLVFKPISLNKKKNSNDPRSKMILSLSEMKKFKACYDEKIAKTPGIGGNFTITFVVTEDGRAENIKITGNTFSDSSVPLCVVKKMADTIFPEGESEDFVEVNFKFSSSGPVRKRKPMNIDM